VRYSQIPTPRLTRSRSNCLPDALPLATPSDWAWVGNMRSQGGKRPKLIFRSRKPSTRTSPLVIARATRANRFLSERRIPQ
jgi:hypothetical protein